MSLVPVNPKCVLCFDNQKLQGGEILVTGEYWYVYVFRNEDGSIQRGMLNPRGHYTNLSLMPFGAGEEYLVLRGRLHREFVPGHDFNVSSNEGDANSATEGRIAGVRITRHLHEHLIPRHDGLPSSSMGLGLLTTKFDRLVREITALADACDTATANMLREIVAKATAL